MNDNSYGAFSRDIQYIGILEGADLFDGSYFKTESEGPDRFSRPGYAPGVGNKINLLVENNIDYIEDSPPEYGLMLIWYFQNLERQVPNEENSLHFWQDTGFEGARLSPRFAEVLLEYQAPDPARANVNAAKASYNFISLPNMESGISADLTHFSNGTIRPHLIIPVTAMADYLWVAFYSQPKSHEYQEDDRIRLWAIPGHDAVGSVPRTK